MKKVRCKFMCQSVTKTMGNVQDENGNWKAAPVYTAEFQVVSQGSAEDKKFFTATPFGNLKIGTTHIPAFEVGQKYYLDITEAED